MRNPALRASLHGNFPEAIRANGGTDRPSVNTEMRGSVFVWERYPVTTPKTGTDQSGSKIGPFPCDLSLQHDL